MESPSTFAPEDPANGPPLSDSENTGATDLVFEKQNGFTPVPNDPYSLAETVARVSRAGLGRMRRASPRILEERYNSWQTIDRFLYVADVSDAESSSRHHDL